MTTLCFDYETYLITPGDQFPKPVCFSYAIHDGQQITHQGVTLPAQGDAILRHAIEQGWRLVAVETAFDVFVNIYHGDGLSGRRYKSTPADRPFDDPAARARFATWAAVADANRLVDISPNQKLLDGAVDRQHRLFKHGLASLAKHWCGVELDKSDATWRLRYSELDGVPIENYPPAAYEYSLLDSVYAALIDIEQQKAAYSWYVSPVNNVRYREIFPSHDLLLDAPNQMRKAFAIKDLAAAGMYTNPRTVHAFEASLIEERDELLVDLVKHGLVRREISLNADAVALRFAKEYNIIVPRLASGRPSITAALYARVPLSDFALHATRRGRVPNLWPATAEALAVHAPDLVTVNHVKNESYIRQAVAWAFTQPEANGEKPNYVPDANGNPTATVKFDADNCERSGNPVLQKYSRYSSICSMLGGAIELGKKAMHAPWHAHYNTLKDNGRTATGSDKGQGDKGNAQNMHRDCGPREMYVAPPGHLIADADYIAAELSGFGQVATWYVGWSECARMIREGVDQHSVFGAALIKLPDPTNAGWKELKKRKKAGDQKADEARTGGKGMSFGCKARMSAKRYQSYAWTNYGLKLSRDESQECINIHNAIIAEMDPYSAAVTSFARHPNKRDTVYDLVHPLTGRLRAGLSYTDVHNYPFSGLAQDWAGAALWDLCKAKWGCSLLGTSDPFFGCFPFLFVHDSVSAYVPVNPAAATAAAKRLGEIMRAAAGRYLPDVGCDTDPNLLVCLSKKAGDAMVNCLACGRLTAAGKACSHKSCEAPLTGDEFIVPFDAWASCAAELESKVKSGEDPKTALAKRGWARYIIADVLAGRVTMPAEIKEQS